MRGIRTFPGEATTDLFPITGPSYPAGCGLSALSAVTGDSTADARQALWECSRHPRSRHGVSIRHMHLALKHMGADPEPFFSPGRNVLRPNRRDLQFRIEGRQFPFRYRRAQLRNFLPQLPPGVFILCVSWHYVAVDVRKHDPRLSRERRVWFADSTVRDPLPIGHYDVQDHCPRGETPVLYGVVKGGWQVFGKYERQEANRW